MTRTYFKPISVASLLLISNATFAQYFTEYTPQRQTVAIGSGASITYSSVPLQAVPWHYTSNEEILWSKTILRDVDATEKANAPFINNSEKPGQTTLASILLDGIFKGVCNVYNGDDDKFTTALSKKELIALLFSQGSIGFNSEQVTKYRIREEWRFVKSENAMTVRITGIAPLTEVNEDGVTFEQPLFWVSYPEVKQHLAGYKALIPGNERTYNWGQYLDSRLFSSKIIKVDDKDEQGNHLKDIEAPKTK